MTTNPKTLLDHFEIDPKKSLGQNFLHDPNALEKIVASAELMPDDVVVEIGPGTGTLTELLARAAKKVYSIEIDERLRPILAMQLASHKNVALVFEDVQEVNIPALVERQPFVVVANIPYYITSAIIRQLLESDHRPRRIVMTVQLELAERMAARPGDLSLMAVSVQFYGKPQIVARFNPAVFWPRPDVASAVIRIDTYEKPPVDVPDEKTFFKVVRAGFSQKRKQLRNAIAGGLAIKSEAATALLERAGIDPSRRAETLTLDEWAALARVYAAENAD
ncbi:MAG: 16S rRNA (adenine(1518)-N(6)/adenine(1519)-N(6))-dimethyltransferase RsmA [bacterium]|nr:16S rRNA (adenine(1518)-N(6)/adenine(1519)-N(6))-dimethyltransferase RsmA [bacterium]